MAKKQEIVKEITVEKQEPSLLRKIGPWAFIIGLLIAVIAALTQNVFWGLGILGLVVGLLNITDKESSMFLLASLTFLLSANTLSVTLTKLVTALPVVGAKILPFMSFIDPLMVNITLFVAPGAAVVALKALYKLSRN